MLVSLLTGEGGEELMVGSEGKLKRLLIVRKKIK
jgi:hypothetical protein